MSETRIGRGFAQVLTEPVRAKANDAMNAAMSILSQMLPGFGIRIEVTTTVDGVPPPYRQAASNEQYYADTKNIASNDAEISRLREALEPFAKAAVEWDEEWDGSDDEVLAPGSCASDAVGKFTVGNLRRAREALSRSSHSMGTT